MSDVFIISFNQLPTSVNKYLRPAIKQNGSKSYAYMYETKEAKSFKQIFRSALKREVERVKWDIEKTNDGHWYLDCVFTQTSTGQDPNNYFKVLLDAMVGVVCMDDKNILPRVQRVQYNSKKPSFQLVLRRVDYVGLFNSKADQQDMIENQCLGCKFYRNGQCGVLNKITEGREVEEYDRQNNICFKFVQKKGK